LTEPTDESFIEKTEVLYNPDEIVRRTVEQTNNLKFTIDSCIDLNGPSMLVIPNHPVTTAFIDMKNRGVKIRFITEITKDNIKYCRQLMNIAEIRHLDDIKGNFGVGDKRVYQAGATANKSGPPPQLIVSTVKAIVDQHQYFFDMLWYKAIPAEQRIKEIEEGIEPSKTEIIQDTKESISRANNIIKSAKEQVLMIWATSKTFVIGMNAGVDKLYSDAISNGAIVKLLIPYGDEMETIVKDLKKLVPEIDIKIAEKTLETKITILIVDRREVMTWELRDDKIENPYEAGGLATYSNNKSIASSYATIFETFWKQTELYEQSQNFNKMQNDFVNIAAHELRTPIQPIIGLSDLLTRSNYPKEKEREMLDVIARNAKRLQRLTEDILDITRIESKSLQLKREQFNLNEMLRNAISEFQNQLSKEYRDTNLSLDFVEPKNDILVDADKSRINQIVSNLLNNAIKFTDHGNVSVMAKRNEHKAIVSIKDTGPGIDPEILPRLFTKFATKSNTGTGLGLYISKNIIEAHSGRIWAENNTDAKGSTFYFSIPLYGL
jgi:signal transduction histidine kinase